MNTTVAEIQDMLRTAGPEELEALERSLAADTRKGVIKALATARRRLEAEQAERSRLLGLYSFDESFAGNGPGVVVGLDEVGRGAVAGPLAVGAVILRHDYLVAALNDSKQLSPEKREIVAAAVKEHSFAWNVSYIDPADIDRDGMSASLRKAFRLALAAVEEAAADIRTVLVDGNPLGIDSRERNIVKGDSKSAAIAAASVIAKVERDALMRNLSSTYPHYGFSDNKGYASADHIAAIREYGLTSMHRVSFCRSFMQESLF